MHLLLFTQIAAPLVAALFLRVDALLLAFMFVAVLAHSACSFADTAYTQPRRHIAPIEQQIHGFLEVLPLAAVALVVVLHWPAIQQPEWKFAARPDALPRRVVAVVLLALLAGLALILEELSRGLRARAIDRRTAA
jgi:hypothetical protein